LAAPSDTAVKGNAMARRGRSLRSRFWVDAVCSTATAVLLVVSLISREWIEALTGFDPDRRSGVLEWLIVVVLAVVSLGLGFGARYEWRRHPATPD
jgi:uncharacterized membrane protein YhaH (DUF805 family)